MPDSTAIQLYLRVFDHHHIQQRGTVLDTVPTPLLEKDMIAEGDGPSDRSKRTAEPIPTMDDVAVTSIY
ncbi:MAG: hypothetical protein HQL69_23405 [Magnetococcales bacterium]|nr:hypothetical protein [Magnetococcales bacterium]